MLELVKNSTTRTKWNIIKHTSKSLKYTCDLYMHFKQKKLVYKIYHKNVYLKRWFGCLRSVVEPPVERLHVREHTFPIGFPHYDHVFNVQQGCYTGFVPARNSKQNKFNSKDYIFFDFVWIVDNRYRVFEKNLRKTGIKRKQWNVSHKQPFFFER